MSLSFVVLRAERDRDRRHVQRRMSPGHPRWSRDAGGERRHASWSTSSRRVTMGDTRDDACRPMPRTKATASPVHVAKRSEVSW